MNTGTRFDVIMNMKSPKERLDKLTEMFKSGEISSKEIRMITHGLLEGIK